jgi:anti-sigma regulatory factor (Ser/Thr protein kinase)
MATRAEQVRSMHAVHFYEDDAQLAQTVGQYLGEAVTSGALAFVVATDPHRVAFERALQTAGLRANVPGEISWLDPRALLRDLVRNGQIDDDAFMRVIGSKFRIAHETGRPLWVYGELVSLLWEQGEIVSALRLEELWNHLAAEIPVSVLCAYQRDRVQADGHGTVEEVCALHSSVISAWPDGAGSIEPGDEVTASFTADRDAPRAARHFVRSTLEGWGHSIAMLADAQLAVTELATNALLHAGSSFEVKLRARPGCVRIAVRDSSSTPPELRESEPMAVSGRGMYILAAIALDWGVERHPDGKTVWAELSD